MMGAATVLARATLRWLCASQAKGTYSTDCGNSSHASLIIAVCFTNNGFSLPKKTFCLIALRKRKSKMIVFGLLFFGTFLIIPLRTFLAAWRFFCTAHNTIDEAFSTALLILILKSA